MKIVLVHLPPWVIENPPINVGYLTAYLRDNDHEVVPFDFNIEAYCKADEEEKYIWRHDLDTGWIEENIEFVERKIDEWTEKILKEKAEVIGLTVYEDSRILSLKLAEKIKDEDESKKIIFGGPECFKHSHLDDMINSEAMDAIVLGEGEKALKMILDKLEEGENLDEIEGILTEGRDDGKRFFIKNLDELPFPDYSDLPTDKYQPEDEKEAAILGSRGCTHNCRFCEDANIAGPYRFRSAENIFREIKMRYEQGYKRFFFNDLMMDGNLGQQKKLCELLIESGINEDIKFNGQLRSRKEMDRDFFEEMKRAGCSTLLYGVESGSQKILNRMKKGYLVDVVERNLKDTHEAGIRTEINMIVGFPGEDEDTIKETIDFLKRNSNYIDRISAVYELEVRPASYIRKHYKEFNIKDGSEVEYWKTEDGKNTFPWRSRKMYEVLKAAKNSGIEVGVDEAHWYFYHLLDYYYEHKKDFEKAYKVTKEALEEFSKRSTSLKDEVKELRKKVKHYRDKAKNKEWEVKDWKIEKEMVEEDFNQMKKELEKLRKGKGK